MAKHYNILSIDGAGMRTILPTMLISYMEEYAYQYANKSNYTKYLDAYANSTSKMSMSYLFDMIAGTLTSSIIAASIATFQHN